MIEAIGEVAARQNRVDPGNAAHDQFIADKKQSKAVEERPVEETEKSDPEAEAGLQEQGETRYTIEDKRLVIEKYNKDGDLLFQMPPVHSDSV
jgi:hypothetical protein